MARDSVTYELLVKMIDFMDHGYTGMEIADMTLVGYSTVCRYLLVIRAIRDKNIVTSGSLRCVNSDIVIKWANANGLKIAREEEQKPKVEEKPQQAAIMSYNTQASIMETLLNIKTLLLSIESTQKESLTILKKYLEV